MKQWNQSKLNNLKIDSRTEDDIKKRIAQLAESYVPEWKFDENHPDIGSVIGILYAKQMMDSIDKYNGIIDRYHIDFANMLGTSLQPATPASTMVVMEVSENTIEGVPVSKGLKLLSEDSGDERIVFETVSDIYVTNSNLVSMFMTSAKKGKIVPLLGEFEEPVYIDNQEPELEAVEPHKYNEYPFDLFDFKKKGIEKHGLMIYHSHLFDVENSPIYIRMTGGEQLIDGILKGKYSIVYYTEDGFKEFDRIDVPIPDMLVLYKAKECAKVSLGEREYSLVLIEAKNNPKTNVVLNKIELSSSGEGKSLDFVSTGNNDLNVQEFEPFGDNLALYKEFYIGQDEYFSKPGSDVTITFDVTYKTEQVLLTKQEEDKELKIIKRRPKTYVSETMVDTFPEQVSIEYYNGNGWKRLECSKPYENMFESCINGSYTLQFVCPKDWQPVSVGAGQGRCLRIQLLKADNCYMRPCTHHYPVISNAVVTYTYQNHFSQPERLCSLSGTGKRDLTKRLNENKNITAFMPSEYAETALYLGFDRKMEQGPVSMLFQLEEDNNFQGVRLKYYYSTTHGFERLKVIDHTNGLMNSNRIIFLPPSDMAQMTLEGKNRYWIKIVDEEAKLEGEKIYRPRIANIYMNAVEAVNAETLPEEDYYIDEVTPNMMFALYATNILSVRLWVNETNTMSDSNKRKMMAEQPNRVRVEYDMHGNISRFLVEWEEVDNFDCSTNGSRHFCVDRMNNRVIFGDGVHVQIPRNTKDVSFVARITCCRGAAANLDPGTISSSKSNLLFVKNIYNPLKSYGGNDMETLEAALRRSANILSSRHRLVSVVDYEREVLSYSDRIAQVEAVVGQTKEGTKDPEVISLVVLLQDYLDNSQSFYHMQKDLKKHLLEQCELSVNPDKLMIVTPQFVNISVELWIEVKNLEDSFELQNQIKKIICDYIDPFTGDIWEIGTMPKESQIRLLIQSIRQKAVIRHMTIEASYQDVKGTHEQSLRDLEVSPFMLCKNGEHKIHLVQK